MSVGCVSNKLACMQVEVCTTVHWPKQMGADWGVNLYVAFQQTKGVDYTETINPVVKPTIIQLKILSLTLSQNWRIRQLDANTTFLNGDITKEVYMSHPVGFEDSHFPYHVCRLKKGIYWLKQASRAQYLKLNGCLNDDL